MDLKDFMNAINRDKVNIIRQSESPFHAEKVYPLYPIQRFLSFSIDSLMYANDMNVRSVSNRQHFEYFLHSLSKKNRWNKWDKPESEKCVEVIKEYYNVSSQKAYEYLSLIGEDGVEELRQIMDKGGKDENL